MQKNISNVERVASTIIGALMIRSALKKPTGFGEADMGTMQKLIHGILGAGIILRAAKGHCPVYQKLNQKQKDEEQSLSQVKHIQTSIMINKTPEEVEAFFTTGSHHNQLNMRKPLFAANKDSHCMVGSLLGLDWTINLHSQSAGRCTRLVAMASRSSDSKGTLSMGLSAVPLRQLVKTTLRNMKSLVETGEIATIAGQPHGKRSFLGEQLGNLVESTRREIDRFPVEASKEFPSPFVAPLPQSIKESMI